MRRLSTFLTGATASLLLGGALPAWPAPAGPAPRASAGLPAAHVVEYDIPSTGVPESIAAGSDGTLWFSERYTSQIGRMTVGGHFKIYSFPMANHMSTAITAGPDGAIWFAFPNSVPSYDTGKIGRITMAGDVTFFQIPWVSDAESVTSGPDGNLWFADHVAAAVGRLTTGGTFTRFDIPGPPGTYPWQLASGPDGALWFTDFNGHRVGRISTGGQVTFFPIPAGDGYPDALGDGEDHAVEWIELGSSGLATEHPKLVTEDQYLDVLGALGADPTSKRASARARSETRNPTGAS
jgi:virginiamycin B lyase